VEAALDKSDASALADLQMHWDEAYEIGLDGDIWLARFRGSGDQLRAHTSHELRDLIRVDYTYRHRTGRPAEPPGPSSSELDDDDSYAAHYDGAHYDGAHYDGADYDNGVDDDAPPPQPRGNFADIRGERMST
jgi:hypothetical protein